VWEWLGFSTKGHSKRLIQKFFVIDKDYKISLTLKGKRDFMTKNDDEIVPNPKKDYKILPLNVQEQDFMTNDEDEIVPHPKKESKSSHGGQNKEIIMLNVKTFKKFCLKAGTKKADEIHPFFFYYVEAKVRTPKMTTSRLFYNKSFWGLTPLLSKREKGVL
jgi:hypothetical protein